MQSKYAALESKSKDVIFQQSNAVSGASLALNDLGSRLRTLIEQLAGAYNISEQELEVIDELRTSRLSSLSSNRPSYSYRV